MSARAAGLMPARRLHRISAAVSMLLLGAAPRLAAEDCAASPLLAGRAAASVAIARVSPDERAASASLATPLYRSLQVEGAYRATRLGDVDRLRHEGRAELSFPVSLGASLAGVSVCPSAGAGYARLSTSRLGTQGEVTTREQWVGLELSHALPAWHALRLTPFVQPMLVHRFTAWRSTSSSWVLRDDAATTDGEAWLGLSLATGRTAVITRFLPSLGGRPGQLGVSVLRSFGNRN